MQSLHMRTPTNNLGEELQDLFCSIYPLLLASGFLLEWPVELSW